MNFSKDSRLTVEEEEILLQNGNKKLVLYKDLREPTVKLFDEVLWGTGDNQYQHKDSRKRLEILDNPNFVELRYNEELAAMCLFINREVYSGGLKHNFFAARYLFSVPKYRDKKLTGKYAILTMKAMQDRQTEPTIFVGVVEHRNKRSFKLVKSIGYEPYSTIKTVGFSRFFPKLSKNVSEVSTEADRSSVMKLLEKFYRGYSMVHFDAVFKEPYFVYRKNGRIVAGVQAQGAHWVVKNIGGKWMKLALKIVPWIPWFKKVFNPNRFEFLGLDGIFFEEGCERELFSLFSHLLRVNRLHSGMFWADERSSLYKQLFSTGQLGFLNTITDEGNSYAMVKTSGIPEEEVAVLKSNPGYHSAFDFL